MAYDTARFATDPVFANKIRARNRRWQRANRQRVRDQQKVYRAANNERMKEIKRLCLFGLTPETFNGMLNKQGGCCAICREVEKAIDPRTGKARNLAIDHNPLKKKGEPGYVRGLLCSNCNNGLGRFKDSIYRLMSAASYLAKR